MTAASIAIAPASSSFDSIARPSALQKAGRREPTCRSTLTACGLGKRTT